MEHGRLPAQPGGELGGQARLPDSGRAEDRDEEREALARDAVEQLAEPGELLGTSDPRRVEAADDARRPFEEAGEPVGDDRLRLPLQGERLDRLDLHGVPDKAVRRLSEEDLPWVRGLLEAGSDVDRIARGVKLAARRIARHDLARVHTRAKGEREAALALELLV
jgi:hypothetical protein